LDNAGPGEFIITNYELRAERSETGVANAELKNIEFFPSFDKEGPRVVRLLQFIK